MNSFYALSQRLSKSNLPFGAATWTLSQIEELSHLEEIENLNVCGFPIVKTSDDSVTLKTRLTAIEDQVFCFVDIETSGNDIEHGQIIEIGAILVKNGIEIDRFESLVYAEDVPENITQITTLSAESLKNAPSLAEVLERFRLFLKDHIFVAHNVNFDYRFISDSMVQQGFSPLLNRKLCTIELAQKCIKSERYGLDCLKELLNIDGGTLHRAFWDAYYSKEIFLNCLKNLPYELFTAEELIEFSNPNPKNPKKKHKKHKKNKK